MSTTDSLTIIARIEGVGPVEVTVPIRPFEDAPDFIDLAAAIEAAGDAVTAAYEALTDSAWDGPGDGEAADVITLSIPSIVLSAA